MPEELPRPVPPDNSPGPGTAFEGHCSNHARMSHSPMNRDTSPIS